MKTATIKDLKNLIANMPDDTPIYDYAPNGCLYPNEDIRNNFGTRTLKEDDIYPDVLEGNSQMYPFNKEHLGKEVFFIYQE